MKQIKTIQLQKLHYFSKYGNSSEIIIRYGLKRHYPCQLDLKSISHFSKQLVNLVIHFFPITQMCNGIQIANLQI